MKLRDSMRKSSIRKKIWGSLTQWANVQQLRQHEEKVLLVLTLMIGAMVGLVIVAFIVLTENLGARMYPAGGAAWRRVVVPVAGSLITGFLLFRYFPGARGSGIPQTKTALFLHSGIIHLRTVLGKFWCSSISLASGIALGREGPSVQVGAGIASVLGRQFGLSPVNVKSLAPIGTAAALAAAFNTPIAAVLFTLEEILGNLHARVLGAIVISSATSWMVLHLLLGDEPLFRVPAYQLVHPVEFALYALLGAVGGLVSVIFVKLLLRLRKYFIRMPAWTASIQPVAGGAFVGIVGLFMPAVLGVGYGHVSEALNGRMALGTMALLVVLKLSATSACYASGNAGGIFGPSLFIGAMLGGAFGSGAHLILPDYTGSVGAYALVGMGVAFAGIIRAPMTSVIMIFEITRDYSIIVPLMIANLISYFISSRLQKKSIYAALMDQDGICLPTALRDRDAATRVHHVMRKPVKIIHSTDRIRDVLANLGSAKTAWPVVDEKGLLGMVAYAQLQEAVQLGRQNSAIADLLPPLEPDTSANSGRFASLHPDQSLDTALHQMEQSGFNVLPVVSQTKPWGLVGVASLRDLLQAHGLTSDEQDAGHPKQTAKAPTAAIGGIMAVVVLMTAIAVFLSYYARYQRIDRAQQYVLSGNESMKASRYQEAVEQYRSALSISHSNKDRLALATALLKADRWNEAEIYFRELVRETPDSGPVNLGLGRIAVQRGEVQIAIDFYHKSIYGRWQDSPQADRTQIRMELIDYLGRIDRLELARVELLSLMAERPDDAAVKRRIAHRLLDYKLAAESARLFRDIIEKSPQDADAYAGLGQAEYSLGNFQSAQHALKTALLLNPSDGKLKQRLEIVEQIVSTDPTLRGLKASEKFERSRELIQKILQSLDQCLSGGAIPLSVAESETVQAVRKSLASKKRPLSFGDAIESNLESAEQCWKVRTAACGPAKASDEILDTLMTRLSR